MQKIGVPGIILYLSKIGATANEGELLADIGIGKNERGICFGKDFWSEILLVLEQTVWDRLHKRNANEFIWT